MPVDHKNFPYFCEELDQPTEKTASLALQQTISLQLSALFSGLGKEKG